MSQRGSGISSVLVRSLLAPALLAALASAARAQDAAVVGQVYDANGAFVGTVIDFDQNEQAARVHGLIQGSIVEFTVRNLAVEEYLDPKTKRVYFTSGDCTGQAYVRADATFPALGGILAGAGAPTQYYFAPSGTVGGNFALASYRDFETAVCVATAGTASAYPVSPIALGYSLPYSMTTDLITQPAALPVPAVDRWGLLGLALALVVAALLGLRSGPPASDQRAAGRGARNRSSEQLS